MSEKHCTGCKGHCHEKHAQDELSQQPFKVTILFTDDSTREYTVVNVKQSDTALMLYNEDNSIDIISIANIFTAHLDSPAG